MTRNAARSRPCALQRSSTGEGRRWSNRVTGSPRESDCGTTRGRRRSPDSAQTAGSRGSFRSGHRTHPSSADACRIRARRSRHHSTGVAARIVRYAGHRRGAGTRLPPKVSALLCAPGARFRADATDASATAGRTRAGSCCPRGSPQALPRHRPRAAPGGPLRVRPAKRRRRLRRAAGTDVCSCLYSCVAWDCKLPLSLSKCFRVQLRGARSDSHSLPLPAAALLTDTKHFEIV